MLDPKLAREIIMDNYQYPNNKSLADNTQDYHARHMASDSCIDDITVQARIKDGTIEEVRFDGQACTISTASTSIMTRLLEGKSLEQAREIIQNFFNMVYEKEFDEDLLEDAIVFESVSKQPNRINCATIGWRGVNEILKEIEDE